MIKEALSAIFKPQDQLPIRVHVVSLHMMPRGSFTQVSGTPLTRNHVLSVISVIDDEVRVHIIHKGRKNGAATLKAEDNQSHKYFRGDDLLVTEVTTSSAGGDR